MSRLIVVLRSWIASSVCCCLILVLISMPVLADTHLDNGAKIFQTNCAGCHANGGNIVRRGKNLKLKALHKNQVDTPEAIATLVTKGKGNMSAYGDKLSHQEIDDVSAYVLQRAAQNWRK